MRRFFNYRPLVAVSVAFAFGITCCLVAVLLNVFLSLFLSVGFVILCVVYFFFMQTKIDLLSFAIVLLFFILGVCLVVIRIDYFNYFQIYDGTQVLINGRIKSVQVLDYKTNFSKIIIENALINKNKIFGDVVVFANLKSFNVGDVISAKNVVYSSKNSKYFLTMLKENTPLYFYADDGVVLSSGVLTVFENLYFTFKNALDSSFGELSPFAVAMLTGNTDFVPFSQLQNMKMAGVSHIFSVSGLHIGFLAGLLSFLLGLLCIKRIQKTIIVFIVILFYSGMCRFSPSSVRAMIMCVVLMISSSFGRKYDLINSISLSMLIVLLINPLDIVDVGFQLSFGAVFSIALFQRTFKDLLRFLPDRLASMLAFSFAIQFGCAPITCFYFGYLSIVSVILNIIFIPFCSILFIVILLFQLVVSLFPIFRIIMVVPKLMLSLCNQFFTVINFSKLTATMTLSVSAVVCYYPIALLSAQQLNTTNKLKYCCIAVCVLYLLIFMV